MGEIDLSEPCWVRTLSIVSMLTYLPALVRQLAAFVRTALSGCKEGYGGGRVKWNDLNCIILIYFVDWRITVNRKAEDFHFV